MRVDDSLKKSIQEVTSWSDPYYNRTNNTCKASGKGQLWDFVQVKVCVDFWLFVAKIRLLLNAYGISK